MLCVHSSSCVLILSSLHSTNNSLISKIYFPQCFFFSKIRHLLKTCLLIRCWKSRFFLWNGVNKQSTHTDTDTQTQTHTHTHTPNNQRKITPPFGIWTIVSRGKLPPVRVGVSVKVRVSFRVGGQPNNCPREKLPPG